MTGLVASLIHSPVITKLLKMNFTCCWSGDVKFGVKVSSWHKSPAQENHFRHVTASA